MEWEGFPTGVVTVSGSAEVKVGHGGFSEEMTAGDETKSVPSSKFHELLNLHDKKSTVTCVQLIDFNKHYIWKERTVFFVGVGGQWRFRA